MRRSEVPQQGTLQGVKVAFAAVSVAGPFFGSMAADLGADVIWIEQPAVPSIDRTTSTGWLDCDRKNMRNMCLDIPSEEGRKVFLDLMKDVDIFLEASKGGQYDKWGLTDEVLWEANPKLIILHLTGFGTFGLPEYVKRASYDPIAQAFGGMMYANQVPGSAPKNAVPLIGDYYVGLFALSSALAAYIKMLRTGQGESIDVNQYEAIVRTANYGFNNWNYPPDHPLASQQRFKQGNLTSHTAGWNGYECADGNFVYMLIFGPSVMKRAFSVFGIEYGTEEWPAKPIYKEFDDEGRRLNEVIKAYCMQHTAAEVEAALNAVGAPAICQLTYDQQLTHPHFLARGTFTKIHSNLLDREVTIPSIYPKMKNSKVEIFRPAPAWGEDTEDILRDLGRTEEEIKALEENKIVRSI